jgi:hypothetical protein
LVFAWDVGVLFFAVEAQFSFLLVFLDNFQGFTFIEGVEAQFSFLLVFFDNFQGFTFIEGVFPLSLSLVV